LSDSELTPPEDETEASSETPLDEEGSVGGTDQDASVSDEASVPSGDAADTPPSPEVAAEDVPEPVAAEEGQEPVAAEEGQEPAAAEEDAVDAPADGLEAEEATSEDEPVAEEPVAPAGQEDVVVEDPSEIVEAEVDEVDVTPRVKPEIPGADLIPDIVPEGEEFLDAEAQAAAEAEAEAAAARAAQEDQAETQPIADAAIDLAAGARYTATGKRKTAVARVILKPGNGSYAINGKPLETAFPRDTLQRVIRQPLEAVGYESRMDVVARMHGGGIAAQAGALRHGISRALLEADPNLRGELKRRGFLTRDPRVKERKKAGLKKARKRPQFSKR